MRITQFQGLGIAALLPHPFGADGKVAMLIGRQHAVRKTGSLNAGPVHGAAFQGKFSQAQTSLGVVQAGDSAYIESLTPEEAAAESGILVRTELSAEQQRDFLSARLLVMERFHTMLSEKSRYRVVYSSDGRAWYTEDHYNTFTELFPTVP